MVYQPRQQRLYHSGISPGLGLDMRTTLSQLRRLRGSSACLIYKGRHVNNLCRTWSEAGLYHQFKIRTFLMVSTVLSPSSWGR